MPYTILFNKKIEKFIENVEEKDKKRLKLNFQSLSENLTPPGTKKIKGNIEIFFEFV